MNTLTHLSLEYLEKNLSDDVLSSLVNKRMKSLFPNLLLLNPLFLIKESYFGKSNEGFLGLLHDLQSEFPSLTEELFNTFMKECKKEEHYDCNHFGYMEEALLSDGFYVHQQCDFTCTCGGITLIFFRGKKEGTYFRVLNRTDFDFDTFTRLLNFFFERNIVFPDFLSGNKERDPFSSKE